MHVQYVYNKQLGVYTLHKLYTHFWLYIIVYIYNSFKLPLVHGDAISSRQLMHQHCGPRVMVKSGLLAKEINSSHQNWNLTLPL